MTHLIIMAAGTGGHVMPGLAVAQEMRARGWSVSWLGTTTGMENRLVPPSGIAMDRIDFTGMRGKGVMHTLRGGVQLLRAFGQCLSILRTRGASAVLGMGGYVCVPGGVMSALLRKPLMLVNADASLLLSTRALLPMAQRVAFGFDGAHASGSPKRIVTGNPVRSVIEALPPIEQRFAGRSGPLRVLVVGGSLGARVLNDVVPRAVASMAAHRRPVVVHQSGGANRDAVIDNYRRVGITSSAAGEGGSVIVMPFVEDMAAQLAACDVIVCRAGAITVSELCAAGVPSVLVPLIVGTTSHQRDNAVFMAQHGAAAHLPQVEFTPERLAKVLGDLDREALCAMGKKAHALARPRAAARVADEIEKLVGGRA
jgi:UDP-N-acetylglucosamine--N-acetylmuramyl-(pentapeptide) pyrophosphoryl-undecaprenol N-acetylglucosamine transferase